ncbi:sensor histidine kinase [Stakelama sp. CBK3Z-3]|uniref:histidine kinase n=1 Tax=Stakelama flava TaxID=2860338 RepID=A0ABS6XN03_9SPHN|nr:ATP-binding protein [Stakelama flava]MBW4331598.1 sensor histidine kinase [Stakelama flava]
MRQLIALRWLAVIGQYATIQLVFSILGVPLPIVAMFAIVGGLVALNISSMIALRRGWRVGERELLIALLLDVAALTGLLYFAGGATNPFVWLFLLQVVLAAVLLRVLSACIVVSVTSAAFILLAVVHYPLMLPQHITVGLFGLYVLGSLISFALIAGLLLLFITRINYNLRSRDARLAAMRQQAAEEDHIVRMGLLASGAAHELGTPLASLSVIINDWGRMRQLTDNPALAEELEEMRVAVERCKAIVSGILMSAGDPRGGDIAITTAGAFFADALEEWRRRHGSDSLRFDNRLSTDPRIVSDSTLKQIVWNILDNGREASGNTVSVILNRKDELLTLSVIDDGPGFDRAILDNLGKPYQSTKGRRGGGLGLFLVVNAMRKMGGWVDARNDPSAGAIVTLVWPLDMLEWTED